MKNLIGAQASPLANGAKRRNRVYYFQREVDYGLFALSRSWQARTLALQSASRLTAFLFRHFHKRKKINLILNFIMESSR